MTIVLRMYVLTIHDNELSLKRQTKIFKLFPSRWMKKMLFGKTEILNLIFHKCKSIKSSRKALKFNSTFVFSHTKLRGGEIIYDVFDYMEDTKGNPSERGRIMVTNLRIIWYSLFNSKLNLCK